MASFSLRFSLILMVVLGTCFANINLNHNTSKYLRVSAVVSNEETEEAEIECWQFKEVFEEYPTVGKALKLGNTSNMTYVVLPPRSKEGLHHPPHPMFFVLLSGIAHVTLPTSRDELWIVQGINPLIVATDTKGLGHNTEYPSHMESVALQIPFTNGIPEHDIIAHSACPNVEDLAEVLMTNQ